MNLDPWLERHTNNHEACGKLAELTQHYHKIASCEYSADPEATSVMLLTILDIWIACDKAAIHLCPPLREYNPGIPREIFTSLLLPLKSQMQRLARAEDHLARRHTHDGRPTRSIFRDFGDPGFFSVQYFSRSTKHQQLLGKIQRDAILARETKRKELREKKERYDSLVKLHASSACEYHEVKIDSHDDLNGMHHNIFEKRHLTTCKKYGYETEAKSMTIEGYEWPLPKGVQEKQCVVFELELPSWFGHWRDTALFLMIDVLQGEHDVAKPIPSDYSLALRDYAGLSSRFVASSKSTQRIGLLSAIKPHQVTHRYRQGVSMANTTENEVSVNSGLIYRYQDSKLQCFINTFRMSEKLPKKCMYMLPKSASSLQRFLFLPASEPNRPAPNVAIASQSDCRVGMTVDEYKTSCGVTFGCRLQWQNILTQLSMPTVDWEKVETALVILQTVYQAGPPSEDRILRKAHSIVKVDTFAQSD